MAIKKNNKRKFVAVGLGLVGIAGLSVASAAQFELNSGNEAAIGQTTFEACVESANVDLSFDAANQSFDGVEVTNIVDADGNASCNGVGIQLTLKGATDNELFAGEGTVANGAASFDIADAIDVTTDVENVTVVIG